MHKTLIVTNDFPPRPGGIQAFLAQPVGGGIEMAFELGKREFRHELFQRVAGISCTCFFRVVICAAGSLP